MKAVVAAFNQEKALVGAFSVITNLWMELFEALVSISTIRHNNHNLILLEVELQIVRDVADDGGDGHLHMDTDTEVTVTVQSPPGASSRCPSRPRSPRRPPPSPRCPAPSAAGRPAGPAAANIFVPG